MRVNVVVDITVISVVVVVVVVIVNGVAGLSEGVVRAVVGDTTVV